MLSSIVLMTDWQTRWQNPLTYIEGTILLLCLAMTFFLLFRFIKKKTMYIIVPTGLILTLVAYIMEFEYLFYTVMVILAVCILVFLFANLGEFRSFFVNPLGSRRKKSNSKSNQRSKDFDIEDVYKKVEIAVKWLSHHKTGAIITFERKNSLSDTFKNAVIINAPVTSEIIETIFYVGTRLHDGAIVIRGATIVAASVFYTPSTKGLTGKYGARHRAALGISEVSDSVTIIVSEETGRVSLAYNKTLESVIIDEFLATFRDAMASVPISKRKSN